MQEMEARVRGFYASWGSTAKGEDDLRRIAAELVEGDGAGLDAFNNKLRKRFYGTCLLSSAVRQCPGTFHQQYISPNPCLKICIMCMDVFVHQNALLHSL